MRFVLLRLLPYIISLLCGAAMYVGAAVYIEHLGMQGLVMNMSSVLLSIPLVFICYEVFNKICSQSLHSAIFKHLSFSINALVIDILVEVKTLLGTKEPLTAENLDPLLQMDEDSIRQRLTPDEAAARKLYTIRDELQQLFQSHHQLDMLTDTEKQVLLGLCKETNTVAREALHQLSLPADNRDNRHLAADMYALFTCISNWLELCETEALTSHRHFRFLAEK